MMTNVICLAVVLAAQTDTSLELSVDTAAGGGLLPTPGVDPDAGPDALRQSRAGGQVRGQVRSELRGVGRRFGWAIGANGSASSQFGDGIIAASSVADPEAGGDAREFLFFGSFGGDLEGSLKLLPTLVLGADVRGAFQRRDAIGAVQVGDGGVGQNQGLPPGTAFFDTSSVDGGLSLTGSAGRRISWGTEARTSYTDTRALNVEQEELGDLADVFSVEGSGFADWAATRRTFLGAGAKSQYASFSGDTGGLQQESVVLTAEGRFRRNLSRRWELALRAGAFVNIPTVASTDIEGAGDPSAFPAFDGRITYYEPPRERFSYQLGVELSLAPQLNQQLGEVVPELRFSLLFDARFDEDWSLAASAFVGSLVDANAFPAQVLQDPVESGSRPLPQSTFGASLAVIRQLGGDWSASLGVRGGGQTRQLFSIRGDLEREGTPEELRGFDVAFAQVVAELGLRWNRVFPL